MNPGLGSGSTNRTNTGGPASSFGIWHEYLGEVKAIAERYDLRIRAAAHATSAPAPIPRCGSACTRMTLDLAAQLPDVASVNLGGGFKVGRMPEEPSVDLADVGAHVRRELEGFRDRDGPRACTSRSSPARTWSRTPARSSRPASTWWTPARDGYLLRQARHRHDRGHAAVALRRPAPDRRARRRARAEADVVFVGPCCESGDILTPAPGDPEALAPRWVPRPRIGDLVVVGGAGAYCAAMATINYNSYPQAPEVMLEPRRHAHAAPPPPGARAGLGERGLKVQSRRPR